MEKTLVKAISEMQEGEAMKLVKEALSKGESTDAIVGECREAMKIVGERFQKSECSMAELVMSSEMLKNISGVLGVEIPEEGFLDAVKQVKSGSSEDSCSTCP